MIRVTIWNEFFHEKNQEAAMKVYPEGIHMTLKKMLESNDDLVIRTATLDEAECGLTQEVLDDTDVLVWWGHVRHNDVPDEVALRVKNRVLNGMGLIPLHSGHMSKPFMLLMGTTCDLRWRESDDKERIWVISPGHPIVKGLPAYFELPHEETYGEYFDIPKPDEVILTSWFSGGEVFRSGCCFTRGSGRIFYFQPGHETYPSYYNEHVIRVILNGIRWVAPTFKPNIDFGWHEAPEKQ